VLRHDANASPIAPAAAPTTRRIPSRGFHYLQPRGVGATIDHQPELASLKLSFFTPQASGAGCVLVAALYAFGPWHHHPDARAAAHAPYDDPRYVSRRGRAVRGRCCTMLKEVTQNLLEELRPV